MASIQDVAKKAKVGVGTVSRVISGNGYVAEATRKKVEKAIHELDYKPNELARNLLHNRTNIIAVIIPDVANPFYSSLVNEIEKELRKYGYKTMLCNTVGEKTNEEVYLDMLERNMVDGILTGTHSLDWTRYARVTRPIVSFDTSRMAKGIPVITVNHKKGGHLAAQALIESGCREVLQFCDKKEGDFPFIERHEEFQRIMKEKGIVCHNYEMNWNSFDESYFQSVVKECFEKYPNVDGVFGTDTLALYYMQYALMCGKKIPEELRVVAYDGTSILKVAYPTVSAIIQPIHELAVAGVEQLLKSIQGKQSENSTVELDVTYQKGMSTQEKIN